MIVLWAASMYLFYDKKNYWLTAVPATFMSAVSATYFVLAGRRDGTAAPPPVVWMMLLFQGVVLGADLPLLDGIQEDAQEESCHGDADGLGNDGVVGDQLAVGVGVHQLAQALGGQDKVCSRYGAHEGGGNGGDPPWPQTKNPASASAPAVWAGRPCTSTASILTGASM